jgi:hypothetical protein
MNFIISQEAGDKARKIRGPIDESTDARFGSNCTPVGERGPNWCSIYQRPHQLIGVHLVAGLRCQYQRQPCDPGRFTPVVASVIRHPPDRFDLSRRCNPPPKRCWLQDDLPDCR